MKHAFLVVVFASVGCSSVSGQQGNSGATNDGATSADTGSDAPADGPRLLASLDDVCIATPPAGFLNPTGKTFVAAVPTGRAVLALLHPPYSGTYAPQGVPTGFSWHGSLTPTAVTIGAAYAGGAITCSSLQCSCDPPGPCSVERCAGPFVGVAINQTIQSADGVFNEVVPSTADSPNANGQIELQGAIPATDLRGSYQISFGPPSEVTLEFDVRTEGSNGGTTVINGAVIEMSSQISGGGGSIH